MNRFTSALILGAVSVAAATAWSQGPEAMGPPKVLVIDREYLKPGKSGAAHEKSEGAYVRFNRAAKWPTYYLAMDSLSGPNRSLFFFAYDSYEAWQKDTDAQAKNAAYSAANDRAWMADGDLLSSVDSSTWNLRPDLSLGTDVDIATMRYFEILAFKVKPGHEEEFENLVKMYVDAYRKSVPTAAWATYSNQYGTGEGGVYLALFPHKALAEIDRGLGEDKRVMDGMGAAGQKRLAELTSASVESVQTNLFHFNPKMSYMSQRTMASDPSFWNPKPAPAPRPAGGATPQ